MEQNILVPWIIFVGVMVNVIVYVKTRCVISVRIGCWNEKEKVGEPLENKFFEVGELVCWNDITLVNIINQLMIP